MTVSILVAEDSVTMRRIMEMTFAGEDAQVTTVESGEKLIPKAEELVPNIIFADLSLSGMDGYSIAREIKSKPALSNTAVIVMASQKTAYNEAKGKEAGVDDYIVKPFDSQQLIDRVKQVLAAPRAKPTVRAAIPTAVPAAQSTVSAATPRIQTKTATLGFGSTPDSAALREPSPVTAAKPSPSAQVIPKAPPPANRPAPKAPSEPLPAAVEPSLSLKISDEKLGQKLDKKLDGIGLTSDQVQAVLALSKEVIEQVVWEVVPDLAEVIIREEIKRLTSE